MRKVILYIAMSLDGYIAKNNGDIDWLSIVENPPEDYGYGEFIKTIDTVILGRKTYEKVLSFGIEFPHRDKKCFVISRTKTGIDNNNVEYSCDPEKLITDLKEEDGKNIFVDGGAEIVNQLLKLDLIDVFVISVIPIFLGSGIKLFNDGRPEKKLRLKGSGEFKTGLVQLCYEKTDE